MQSRCESEPPVADRPWLDRLGIGVSLACAVHCMAAALLAAAPAFAAGAAPHLGERLEWLEGALLWMALGVGIAALLPAARDHRNFWPIGLFTMGMGVLGFARLLDAPGAETVGTVSGVALVATAHVLNLRAHAHGKSHAHAHGKSHAHAGPTASNAA